MADEGMVEDDSPILQHHTLTRGLFSTQFNDMPDDIVEAIFQHMNLLDRVRMEHIFPGRYHHLTRRWLSRECAKFKISYRTIRDYGGFGNRMTERDIITVVREILNIIGATICDLTINYSLGGWTIAAREISKAVHRFCRHIVRMHVLNVSAHHVRPHWLVIPFMGPVESFVFTDKDWMCTRQPVVREYLAACSDRLESLSINYAYVEEASLYQLVNLKYLRLRTNVIDDDIPHPGRNPTRPAYIDDLVGYCKKSPIRHLDVRQQRVNYFDARAMLWMPYMSHLTLAVEWAESMELNEVLRQLILVDRIEYLHVTVIEDPDWTVEYGTMEAISRTRRLKFLHLVGVTVSQALLQTMVEQKEKVPDFTYVFRGVRGDD